MKVRILTPVLALMLALAVVACSDDDEPDATPSASVAESTASPTMPVEQSPTAAVTSAPTIAPSPSSTETPGAGPGQDEVDPDAIWEPTLGLDRLQQACPDKLDDACLDAIGQLEREDGAPEQAIAFFDAYDVFLFTFEEHGTVDFGSVTSPLYNMGRPEPVFLNGDFGLLYVGEVIPQDWQDQPSYEETGSAVTWQEYSELVDVEASDQSQVFLIAVPLRECRACEDAGYLNLQVTFGNAALGTRVLPFTKTPPTPTP